VPTIRSQCNGGLKVGGNDSGGLGPRSVIQEAGFTDHHPKLDFTVFWKSQGIIDAPRKSFDNIQTANDMRPRADAT
jgi:hypothetical protein